MKKILENLIEVQDLDFYYPGRDNESPILDNISFNIKTGDFIAVVGPNGCGKSTLIRHFNGLLLPTAGCIKVRGLTTEIPDNLHEIRRKVGMVFQNPDTQLFASVVEEDVAFGVENMCLSRDVIKTRVNNALEQVGMSGFKNHPPHRLSGGQKQKVAIAGILAMEPKCIVLDEPTSMLDPKGRNEVMEAVRALNRNNGITIVYVTHDMSEALLAHRILALSEGRIVFDGTPEEFFTNEEAVLRVGVKAPPIKELVNSLAREGITLPTGIKTPEELVDAVCQLNSKM